MDGEKDTRSWQEKKRLVSDDAHRQWTYHPRLCPKVLSDYESRPEKSNSCPSTNDGAN